MTNFPSATIALNFPRSTAKNFVNVSHQTKSKINLSPLSTNGARTATNSNALIAAITSSDPASGSLYLIHRCVKLVEQTRKQQSEKEER
jgi:hypothetical protein